MYSLVILALAAQQVVAFTAPFGARRSFSSRMMMMSDSEPEAAKEMMSSGGPEVVKESSTEENEIDIDMDSLAEESASSAFTPKQDLSSMYISDEKRKAPRQAQWFPMLLSPAGLDGTLAGDVGFDPLGFAKDKETAYRMREAELKHARLAMLAAAGWPLSELWHREIADALGLDSILTSSGEAPSVLNGGLANEWIIGAGVFSLVVGGILEFQSFGAAEKSGYRPGNLNFDPLNLHAFRSSFGLDQIALKLTREEKLEQARFDMELCEIKNGRLAMLAISAYAAQEFVTGIPVVQQTPFFFGDPIM